MEIRLYQDKNYHIPEALRMQGRKVFQYTPEVLPIERYLGHDDSITYSRSEWVVEMELVWTGTVRTGDDRGILDSIEGFEIYRCLEGRHWYWSARDREMREWRVRLPASGESPVLLHTYDSYMGTGLPRISFEVL